MPSNPNEIAPHNMPKQHSSYEEKPQTQVINEMLTDETPTGYKPDYTETLKTSGDSLDAGDWTTSGDGTNYPNADYEAEPKEVPLAEGANEEPVEETSGGTMSEQGVAAIVHES